MKYFLVADCFTLLGNNEKNTWFCLVMWFNVHYWKSQRASSGRCVTARRWKWLKQAEDKFQTLHTVRDVRGPKCCWNVSHRTHIFVFSCIIVPLPTRDNEHVSHCGSMCAHFHTRWHINWCIMPERDSSMTSRSWQLRVKTQPSAGAACGCAHKGVIQVFGFFRGKPQIALRKHTPVSGFGHHVFITLSVS